MEEIGEMVIHCCYGCRPVKGSSDEFEVDPSGKMLKVCTLRTVMSIITFYVRVNLAVNWEVPLI